jgi:deferrochelatase/peroxidase EfeB
MWRHGVPIRDRGPGESYRPEDVAPSLYAARQPGITTPMLDHVAFGALDVVVGTFAELREVMDVLSAEGERLMQAEHRHGGGAPAGALTVTIGLGPRLFGERFGLRARRPVALRDLPAFPGDALDPATSGGDLALQVCADVPGKASDALDRLVDLAWPAAGLRWSQRGSVHRLPGDRAGGRPRNLLGFKEATGNPRRGKDLHRHVWVSGRDQSWMTGGTYLVVRRVRVLLDAWNALSLEQQERVIGRHRDSGAPLGRTHEFERLPEGDPMPPDAHARLAAPRANGGATLLRRGYSYDNGTDASDERDAGLLLLLYGKDPRRQYVPLQRHLAEADALARFTRPVGSAIFAIPPGAGAGGSLFGESLSAG